MKLFLFLFLFGCNDGRALSNPGGTEVCNEVGDNCDSETDTDNGTDSDADSDSDGAEIVCGGPAPPSDSIWECESGTSDLIGPPWPISGGPSEEGCYTTERWVYELFEGGKSVILSNEEDGRQLNCTMQ